MSTAVLERPLIPLTLDAKPHNGWLTPEECRDRGMEPLDPRRDFRDKKTGLGGQVLLLHMCLQFKRVVAPVGRRWGKTTFLGFLFMEEAARTPGMYYAGVFEQDHPKAKSVMEVFITAWGGDPKKNPASLISGINRSEGQGRYIQLKPMTIKGQPDVGNLGARIYFWSSKHPHYNAVRGIPHAFHRIVPDEAALIRGECISRVVIPMLLDVDGSLLVIGTPDVEGVGEFWFEQFWHRAMSMKRKWRRWAGMNFPSDGNPFIPQAGLDELDKEYEHDPVAALQEREGRFPDTVGGVWGNVGRFCTLRALPRKVGWVYTYTRAAGLDTIPYYWFSEHKVHSKVRYVMTADWGKKMDQTVIGVYRLDNGHQVALFALNGEDYEEQMKFVKLVRMHYGETTSLQVDGNGIGDGMVAGLAKRHNESCTPHIWTGHNKESYVRQGVILAKTGGVKLINCPEQREQFRIYLGEKNDKTGRIRYGHPDGAHDDFVDQFLYAVKDLMVPMTPEHEVADGVPEEGVGPKRGTFAELRQQIEEARFYDSLEDSII